jgi:hypothetical protein
MQYPHRRNRDGSVDSICPRCIATIASSTNDGDLKWFEMAHVCQPWRLAYFQPKSSDVTWFVRSAGRHRASA